MNFISPVESNVCNGNDVSCEYNPRTWNTERKEVLMKTKLAKLLGALSLVSVVACPGYVGPDLSGLVDIDHDINAAPVLDTIWDSDPGIPAPTL